MDVGRCSRLFSVLLHAYFSGNGSLCRAVVRAGGSLGAINKEGMTIFNAPVATKQLLFKLLGKIFFTQLAL